MTLILIIMFVALPCADGNLQGKRVFTVVGSYVAIQMIEYTGRIENPRVESPDWVHLIYPFPRREAPLNPASK